MKKMKYLLVTLTSFLISMPVMAKDTNACKGALNIKIDAKIPDTVHTIVLALQIIVPILLVIFGMIDLIKAVVAGKEDEIKKAQGVFVKRLIAGALVFFVIAIVKLLINFAANFGENESSMWDCINVFLDGTKK